jgi:hypothetical protein
MYNLSINIPLAYVTWAYIVVDHIKDPTGKQEDDLNSLGEALFILSTLAVYFNLCEVLAILQNKFKAAKKSQQHSLFLFPLFPVTLPLFIVYVSIYHILNVQKERQEKKLYEEVYNKETKKKEKKEKGTPEWRMMCLDEYIKSYKPVVPGKDPYVPKTFKSSKDEKRYLHELHKQKP